MITIIIDKLNSFYSTSQYFGSPVLFWVLIHTWCGTTLCTCCTPPLEGLLAFGMNNKVQLCPHAAPLSLASDALPVGTLWVFQIPGSVEGGPSWHLVWSSTHRESSCQSNSNHPTVRASSLQLHIPHVEGDCILFGAYNSGYLLLCVWPYRRVHTVIDWYVRVPWFATNAAYGKSVTMIIMQNLHKWLELNFKGHRHAYI